MTKRETRKKTIRLIYKECKKQGITEQAQVAYIIATVAWETNHTYKPVKEAYWLTEKWRKRNLRYYPYYGRGFVQLTWRENYKKYGKIMGLDLVGNPDLALDSKVAAFILVHGFKHGLFTGVKISDFIGNGHIDFESARRCINGTDKAIEIAMIARSIKFTKPTKYA